MSGYSAGRRHFRFAKVALYKQADDKTIVEIRIQPGLSFSCEQSENFERFRVNEFF